MSEDIPKTQKAVVFTGSQEDGKLTEIKSVPVPVLPDTRILVHVKAAALNPVDWKCVMMNWGDKSTGVGCDGAGVVVAVGSEVKDFRIGDDVSFMIQGDFKSHRDQGAFREYVAVDPDLAIKYEHGLVSSHETAPGKVTSFWGAASIPLSLFTVGRSLHHSLHLTFDKEKNKGQFILIWGGATAAGIQAIQVAKKLYGLTVVATASKKHHSFLKGLGADFVFDYHDPDVISEIKTVVGDDLTYALDTVSHEKTYNLCYQVISSSKPAYLDNLLVLGKENIKGQAWKSNVTLTQTAVFYAENMKPSERERTEQEHLAFLKVARKAVNEGTIVHPPLSYVGGYSAVDRGYSMMRAGSVSGEKVIVSADL